MVQEAATVVAETPKPDIPVVAEAVAVAPVAPVSETPAAQVVTPEAKPTVPVPAPAAPPEEQAYIASLEQQVQNARQRTELQTLNQAVDQYSQQLQTQYGLSPEQAQVIAKTQGDILYGQYQAEQTHRGQVRAAIAIGKEFGVDPLQLIDLTSPQAMRQTAQTLSGTNKQTQELAELRAQVAKLTKSSVPAQTFAQGAQPGAATGVTGDALEAAWLKQDIEHPDQPNPYDAAYRTMLRR